MSDSDRRDHGSPGGEPDHGAAPFLCIAVPVLNEERYLTACLDSLLPQWPADRCEVLVLDGGSTDRTREIVNGLAARHPQLRLVDNPDRLQSAAVNLAADLADPRATVLLRADAHALYPEGFVAAVVSALHRHDATSVVVPMRNQGRSGPQRAIAAAQGSRFGNGGAAHRAGGASGWVDHGHHAAFDLDFFRALGGYDPAFSHNEDAEFDHRARAAGGRVWMCAEAAVTYFPRRGLLALARQYSRHGNGRARTLLKHRLRPRPRQMAPLAALLGNGAAAALSPSLPALLLVPAGYAALCLGWGALLAVRRRDPWVLMAAPAAATMHHAWAFGFLRRALPALLRRGRAGDTGR